MFAQGCKFASIKVYLNTGSLSQILCPTLIHFNCYKINDKIARGTPSSQILTQANNWNNPSLMKAQTELVKSSSPYKF